MSSQEPPQSGAPQVLSGRYEIHRKLARGGMAEVYLARDRSLDRPVAVKVLFPEFATDPAFVERFRREAQAAANLAHPNIVGVYDWGTEGGTYFIVMEFVDGQSLAEVMRTAGPLHPRRAAEIAFEVAGALGFAHAKGVVHRDVKPGNVIISSSGVSKVTDFGIARALSSPSEDLTQAGSVMGTATYFSPEQAQGFAVDARSDLYSLGVVLFEMVTGRPPFAGDSPVAIAYKHVQETPPRPSQFVTGIPLGLEAIIGRLLAKDPDHRYLSADDLRADLRRWLDGDTPVALAALQRNAGAGVVDPNATVAVAGAAIGAAVAPARPDPGATRAVAATAYTANQPVAAPAGADPYDDEFGDERNPRTGLFIALLVVLLAVVAGLVFWLVRSVNDNSASTAKVNVPNVVGLTQDEAEKALDAQGFTPVPNLLPNDTTELGKVFEQSPPANSQLEKGKQVVIKVSTGAAKAKIPTGLAGLSQADALAKLSTAGFTTVTPTPTASDTVVSGTVIGTDPAEGTEVATSSEIKLLVSSGKAGVPIPDVKGKTQSQAKTALKAAGFVVGDVQQQASSDVDKDLVIGTDPTGSAEKGSTVNLLVSTGPQQVKVPAVKGMSEADARNAITGQKLQVESDFKVLAPGDPSIGRVISVDPVAGTPLDINSIVKITVGAPDSGTTTTSSSTTSTTVH